MKHYGIFRFLLIPAALALCVSCTDFFTTSLGEWAARDPDKLIPSVNAGNVNDILSQVDNDPNASLAVLKKIKNAMANASPEDAIVLQNAALEAAVNSVGLVQAVLGVVTSLDEINVGSAPQKIADAVNGMKNLGSVGDELFAILPDVDDDPDSDFQKFITQASPDDLAFAAVVLLAGEAKQKSGGNLEEYMSTFDPGNTGSNSDIENLAVELVKGIDPTTLTGPLGDIMRGLNLIVD